MATDGRNRTLDLRPPPFPDDFGQRLEGLKDMTGLSWGEFAELLGVTERGLLKWAQGRAAFWDLLLGHHQAGPRGSRRLRPDTGRRCRGGRRRLSDPAVAGRLYGEVGAIGGPVGD